MTTDGKASVSYLAGIFEKFKQASSSNKPMERFAIQKQRYFAL